MEYGLVLAGGGVRGAYQIGVWKALKELNIKVSAVSGVSIGAVNGALFVQGSKTKAERLWNKIAIDDIISLPKEIENDENLFKVKNLMKIAELNDKFYRDFHDVDPAWSIDKKNQGQQVTVPVSADGNI